MVHCCLSTQRQTFDFSFSVLCSRLEQGGAGLKCAGWGRCLHSWWHSVSSSSSLVACFTDVDGIVGACKTNGSVFLNTWNCGYHSWTRHSLSFNILSGLLRTTACTQAIETSAGERIGPWAINKAERGRWEVTLVTSIDQVERDSILDNSGQQIWGKSDGRQQQQYLQAILYTSKPIDPTTLCCPRSSFQVPRFLFHP